MADYKQIIDALREIADRPGRQVKKYKENGGKAVGCFPVYTPEEIIHAAGMLPVGLWGGQTDIDEAKAYVPAFACSIMQSCLEYGLRGVYDDISAVLIPSMCDTLKCVGQNFKIGVPHIRHIQFTHPQMRQIEAGMVYLHTEYSRVRTALEEVAGKPVTEEALEEAIAVYNAHRAEMRRFVDVAAVHCDIITPSVRHAVIKSGFFMRKDEHTAYVQSLNDALQAVPENRGAGKRVMITGILAEPPSLLDLFADNGLSVVCDDLAQETRQFRHDVPDEGADAISRIAKWWSLVEGCSLAYDPSKKRFDLILSDVEKYGADGVVVCMMKFCDPEEYDYALLKKALDEKKIPTLYMEIDQQSEINEQARTRIQGFAEILEMTRG